MNEANVHARLNEIIKAAKEADKALSQSDAIQFELSIELIQLHLRAIKRERIAPEGQL